MKTRLILVIYLLFLNVVVKAQEKKNFLTFPTGINTIKLYDFHSYNLGLGYEFRPVYYLGFELSGFYGTFSHDDYSVDHFLDEIQCSYMLYDGNFSGMKLSNRGYLYFNDKRKIALFGEYYLGGYFINSDAEGVYKEMNLRGSHNSGLQFFHGIAVGTQLSVTQKLHVSVSIGENSIDFSEALGEMTFNDKPDIDIPYKYLNPIVFQFELMVLL